MKNNTIHSFPGRAKGKRDPIVRDSVPFKKFLKAIPTAPIVDLAPNYAYPMDGNDTVGDCVVAAWDHFRQVVTGLLTGTAQNFTQDELWSFYKTQNPDFDPNGTPDTNGPGSSFDCGMSVQTFLEYLQSTGYIVGFAKIDQTNESEMKAAVYLGLGIITGVVLDEAQMDQFDQGIWDNVSGSPADGGHCIPLVGYLGTPDQITCVTWAKLVQCTQAFILDQMDEAWFVITPFHIANPGFRDHFDLEGFANAVSEITNGVIVIPSKMKPAHIFAVNLKAGMISPEVLMLQKCLNFDPETQVAESGPGSQGDETNMFGTFTLEAVIKFQTKYDILPEAGYVGPITRAQLNAFYGSTPIKVSDVIIQNESEGDAGVTGDLDIPLHAYGCMQIRQPVCDDVNKHFGTAYEAVSMLGIAALADSIDCFNKYMEIYCSSPVVGISVDEQQARCWNSGPNWQNEMAATNEYWARYQANKSALIA